MHHQKLPANKRERLRLAWNRITRKVLIIFNELDKWVTSNEAVRELKHRAPALAGYAESIVNRERAQLMMPAVVPPSTTRAPGQTKKSLQTPYPEEMARCPHPLMAARRLGNVHGKFLECMDCGLVKKALPNQYYIPGTGEMVNIYAIEHGLRLMPGGSLKKFGPERKGTTTASSPSLSGCYLCSAPSSMAQASNASRPMTTRKPSKPTSGNSAPLPDKKVKKEVIDAESVIAWPLTDTEDIKIYSSEEDL